MIVGHPDIEFTCIFIDNAEKYSWNTRKIRDHFGDDSLSKSETVHFIREALDKIFNAIHV